MTTKKLVKKLKEENQDFEMYPSTYEMLSLIYEHMKPPYSEIRDRVLDIGCGTCNFANHFKKWADTDTLTFKLFGMEKSKILIDKLDKDVILLGTDFNQSTLIDKETDVIFSNPPYSEYEEWMQRIIFEGNCKSVYLIVPERWKENKNIQTTIKKLSLKVSILGSFNFLNAERSARAKVEVLYIDKRYTSKDAAFDQWFDETFELKSESETDVANKERVKNALVGGKNKVEMLVELYEQEQKVLFNHFTAISNLDLNILESIGVSKKNVKESLKSRISGLKILYWEIVFENLDEITSRLTIDSRRKMLDKFSEIKQVDFTHSNIYALIVYVIKNANKYYEDQLLDLFKRLSSKENVIPYKSNQKTFNFDKWRYHSKDNKYILDYRIISTSFDMQDDYRWKEEELYRRKVEGCIGDFCTIANNLGFEVGEKEYAEEFGKKAQVFDKNGKVLFEYRTYKNRNTHFKVNKELIKAINVESSRLLGWIRGKSDITAEFTGDTAKGSEKYFKQNSFIPIGNPVLMLNGK